MIEINKSKSFPAIRYWVRSIWPPFRVTQIKMMNLIDREKIIYTHTRTQTVILSKYRETLKCNSITMNPHYNNDKFMKYVCALRIMVDCLRTHIYGKQFEL